MTMHDTTIGRFRIEVGAAGPESLEQQGFRPQDGRVSVPIRSRSVALTVWTDDVGELALAGEVAAGVWAIGRQEADEPEAPQPQP